MRGDCLSRSPVVRFGLLLAAWLAVFAGAQASADLTRYNDAVVRVEAQIVPDGQTVQSLGANRSGSGVILDARTVLTIGYVVVEAEQVTVVTANGRRAPGNVVGYDHETGFGLVRTVVPLTGQALELGDSDRVAERHRPLSARTAAPIEQRAAVAEAKVDQAVEVFPHVE